MEGVSRIMSGLSLPLFGVFETQKFVYSMMIRSYEAGVDFDSCVPGNGIK